MSCNTVTLGIDPACAATNKKGGLNKRIYITDKANVTAYTIDGTSKKITGITMTVSTYLYKFVSKDNMRNSYKASLVPGENANMWNHILDAVLYADTQLEYNAINALCNANEVLAIVQRNSGEFMILGLDTELGNPSEPEGGMKAASAEITSGIQINDDTSIKVSLSGQISHPPVRCFFAATQTLEIAYLDALLAP